MKLWIDDLRPAPDGWHWVKTSFDALRILWDNRITHISFDHDLGGDDTAVRVADWIEEQAWLGSIPRMEWSIHSANPVGRSRLRQALDKADAHWTHNELAQERVEVAAKVEYEQYVEKINESS